MDEERVSPFSGHLLVSQGRNSLLDQEMKRDHKTLLTARATTNNPRKTPLPVRAGLTLCLCSYPSISIRTPSARPVQRRYSEATLASDYSRTMDNMLKKNFVEWLLARREKKSE